MVSTFRILSALVFFSVIFTSIGCGKKKSKGGSTAPANSGDQVAGTQGPKGDRGAQGERGLPGVGVVFSHDVRDANGVLIGKTSWEHFAKFNDGQSFAFQLSDGAIFSVQPFSGSFDGGAYCFYASPDCSGACLFPASPGARNKIIQGHSAFYWLKAASSRVQMSYASYAVNNGAGGTVCSTPPTPGLEWMVSLSTPWTMPAGFIYPVAVPMDLTERTLNLTQPEVEASN